MLTSMGLQTFFFLSLKVKKRQHASHHRVSTPTPPISAQPIQWEGQSGFQWRLTAAVSEKIGCLCCRCFGLDEPNEGSLKVTNSEWWAEHERQPEREDTPSVLLLGGMTVLADVQHKTGVMHYLRPLRLPGTGRILHNKPMASFPVYVPPKLKSSAATSREISIKMMNNSSCSTWYSSRIHLTLFLYDHWYSVHKTPSSPCPLSGGGSKGLLEIPAADSPPALGISHQPGPDWGWQTGWEGWSGTWSAAVCEDVSTCELVTAQSAQFICCCTGT